MDARPIVNGDDWGGKACAGCEVRHHSICDSMADPDLARLSAAAVHMELRRGEVFIDEGEPATDFYNVTHGTVKLFKLLHDGRQQITGFAPSGHFLGLAVAQTYAFSAEAIEPVRRCRFSRPKLRRLLDDFPEMERRLLETACNELATAQDQMLLLGRKTAAERVASFLIAWSDVSPSENGAVHLPMTRSEIADYLGLTIETVSRTLSRFRKEHRITTPSNDEVILLDRPWLTLAATGEQIAAH